MVELTAPRCRWAGCAEPSSGEAHGSIGPVQVALPLCDEHVRQASGHRSLSISLPAEDE